MRYKAIVYITVSICPFIYSFISKDTKRNEMSITF